MRSITLLIVLILTGATSYGQNLIGYNDTEIRKYMKENHKNLNFDTVINSKFKYLKYSDNLDNQTLLFFLNPESVCKSVRIICDRSIIGEKLKEFNSIYKKSGENKWTDSRGGNNYLIEIRDEKWSYVVTIDQDK